jgi:hypothetical protein
MQNLASRPKKRTQISGVWEQIMSRILYLGASMNRNMYKIT